MIESPIGTQCSTIIEHAIAQYVTFDQVPNSKLYSNQKQEPVKMAKLVIGRFGDSKD